MSATDANGRAGRADHPLVAGGFAVSLVVLLVLAARLFADPDRTCSLIFCLLVVAVACLALIQAITTRVRTRRPGLLAAWEAPNRTEALGMPRHKSWVPANRATTLLTQDGRRIRARIANISMTAVAIEAKISERDYASVLRVGSREVGPVGRTATGAVFGFRTMLDPQPFDDAFVL